MSSNSPLSRLQVLALIEEHAPPHLQQLLAENLQAAIALSLQVLAEDDLPLGASKIGGAPDVPHDFDWPQWNAQPLGFLAQFDLAQVAPFDVDNVLPDAGTLSFFYAIDEQPWGFSDDVGGWRIYYWSPGTQLLRQPCPDGKPNNRLRPHATLFKNCWTLPDRFSGAMINVELDESVWDDWDDFARLLHNPQGNDGRSQLLGQAMPVQNDVLFNVVTDVLRLNRPQFGDNPMDESVRWEHAAQWRLLFQLDSQHNEQTKRDDWSWGDCGMLYFCIRRDDLKNHDFNNVWLQLQCY